MARSFWLFRFPQKKAGTAAFFSKLLIWRSRDAYRDAALASSYLVLVSNVYPDHAKALPLVALKLLWSSDGTMTSTWDPPDRVHLPHWLLMCLYRHEKSTRSEAFRREAASSQIVYSSDDKPCVEEATLLGITK